MGYLDGGSGRSMIKRFNITAITRDKEYDLTKGAKGSKTLYLTANPNGEAEVVTVKLTSGAKARIKVFEFDFATLDIKGRGAGGNILTKYPVRKIELKSEGLSTLSGLDIWYDDAVGRLNKDERGHSVGNFNGDDKILVVYKDGSYELTTYELTNRYEPQKILWVKKLESKKPVSVVHYDGESKNYLVKRFLIETTTVEKKFNFISEAPGSKLIIASLADSPIVSIDFTKGKSKEKLNEEADLSDRIEVKGWKALGNKQSPYNVKKVKLIAENNLSDTSSVIVTPDQKNREEQPENSEPVSTVENTESKKNKSDNQGEDRAGYTPGETIELDF